MLFVCLSVSAFEDVNRFSRSLWECYAIGDRPSAVLSKFLNSVITWRTRELEAEAKLEPFTLGFRSDIR
jgi:hypothetical protein